MSIKAEYQSMIEDYQNNEVSYDDLTKQDKIAEIQGLEQRITTFQQSAQTSLQNKEIELLRPIEEKAQNSINSCRKRKVYIHLRLKYRSSFILKRK